MGRYTVTAARLVVSGDEASLQVLAKRVGASRNDGLLRRPVFFLPDFDVIKYIPYGYTEIQSAA